MKNIWLLVVLLSIITGVSYAQTSYEQQILQAEYAKKTTRYKEFRQFIDAKKKSKSQTSNDRTMSTDMTLDIRNQRLDNISGATWFEFDIYVSSNTSIYLDVASINFNYNTSVFGNYVDSLGNFVMTPAPAFANTTYDPAENDYSSSIASMAIEPDVTNPSLNRTLISSSAQILCTVRFKIQNCSLPVNISFANVVTEAGYCFYATSANQSIFTTVAFDNVNYNGNITDNSCDPIISNWTNNVPAGVNKNVTITGHYFGNGRGAGGAVILTNADRGNRYPAPGGPTLGGLQDDDITTWNDSTITFTLPGILDSAFYYTNANPPVLKGPTTISPGTGKFKVINFAGGQAESSSPLIIPYCVTEWIGYLPTYHKVHASLAGPNSNGYRVLINSRINTAWSDAKSTIRRAMEDWTCATGINWYIGGDTTLKYQTDAFCVIDTGGISSLMQTKPYVRACPDGSSFKYYLQSFDILIRQSVSPYVWFRDTLNNVPNGDYDFYSAISHELGHGHGLEHINDSTGDLMWWQALPYGYTYATRKLVRYSPAARTGGEWVTDSLLGSNTCVSAMTLTYTGNCEGIQDKVKSYGMNIYDIAVFPNPSSISDNVRIKFELPEENNVSLQVFDITGKRVFYDPLGKIKSVDYNLCGQFTQGIYLLEVNIGEVRQSFKLLKE